jgi:toxin CptA
MDLSTPTLLLAVALVFMMGLAIQKGATCMVIAISDLVLRRRAGRAWAILIAALWVATILGLAARLGFPSVPPLVRMPGWQTLAGGMLLGLGAHANRACVFGAVARAGNGERVYLLTPAGFFAGALAGFHLLLPPPAPLPAPQPFVLASPMIAPVLLVGLLLLLARTSSRRWTPANATAVIGICFGLLFLVAGPWAYTDALSELAQAGAAAGLGERLLLLLVLFAGARAGGRTQPMATLGPRVSPWRVIAGSAAMGTGSVMIPGSNDGLLLLGIPFLSVHAVAALGAMSLAIAGALLAERAVHRSRTRSAA